jgi:cytochrome b involved in lipid metabolism
MLASLFVSGAICYNQSQNIPSLKFPNYVAECEQKWKTIKREEVAKHKTKETRLWVTYKKGVFDITGWLEGHPGGKPALFQAAGGPIEPFWSTYRLHYEPKFETLLNTFKIGELPDDEVMEFDDSLIPWPRQNIASRTAMTLLT